MATTHELIRGPDGKIVGGVQGVPVMSDDEWLSKRARLAHQMADKRIEQLEACLVFAMKEWAGWYDYGAPSSHPGQDMALWHVCLEALPADLRASLDADSC